MATPEVRKQRARMGGLALAASRNPLEYTAAARKASRDRFLEEVDRDGQLRKENPQEAERRAEAARRLFYVRIAFKSARDRASRKKKTEGAFTSPPVASPEGRTSATPAA